MTNIFRTGGAATAREVYHHNSVGRTESFHPPERANDSPTVAASVDLELVGVRVMKRHTISQPEHIRGVIFFSPCASQGTVHDNRLSQRRDDSPGILFKHQIFGWGKKRLGLIILSNLK